MVRRSLLAAVAVVVVTAACGASSGVFTERADPPPTSATTPSADTTEEATATTEATVATAPTQVGEAPELEWQAFDEQMETAILEVPVDYDDPDGPTIQLVLVRRLADDQENKIGSLLINPGGPGLGGVRVHDQCRARAG